MFDLQAIVRPNILNIKPYSSARDDYSGTEGVFLDANENPIGSVGGGAYNRYPDPYQRDLKSKIADLKNVKPEHIFLGNGSDEPIDLLFRVFCEPRKDNVIICPPTYGMYQVCADVNDVAVKNVPLTADYQLHVKSILEAVDQHTKAIFICTPNNPTGNLLDNEHIKAILKGFPQGIVFVDEAYIDFTLQESWNQYLDLYPNLIVIQTFSKAWGLAGLRLGMAFASQEILSYYNKVKYPYNIGRATLEVAIKAVEHLDEKNDHVEAIILERQRLEQELNKVPAVSAVIPSDANSILFFVPNAHGVYQKLCEQLVIVRDRSKVLLCTDSLRVSVGTAQENTQFLEALRQITQGA